MSDQVQKIPLPPRFLAYPYRVGGNAIPATTGADAHLNDLILQVLFTAPGERVNLPEFGVGVQRLVFSPVNDALRSATQFLIATGLRRWLGDRIDVGQVTVGGTGDDPATVVIQINYTVKATQQTGTLLVEV
jgi:phage baseplate assembly protein W